MLCSEKKIFPKNLLDECRLLTGWCHNYVGRSIKKTEAIYVLAFTTVTLLTRLAIYYNKHCKVAFGTYVQVQEEGDNLSLSRTSGAMALGPIGNEQF